MQRNTESPSELIQRLRCEHHKIWTLEDQESILSLATQASRIPALEAEVAELRGKQKAWRIERMEGRREALAILTRQDPEEFTQDYIGYNDAADKVLLTATWDHEKLRLFFDCDKEKSFGEKCEDHYHQVLGEKRSEVKASNRELFPQGYGAMHFYYCPKDGFRMYSLYPNRLWCEKCWGEYSVGDVTPIQLIPPTPPQEQKPAAATQTQPEEQSHE
jgi:hypothetical protein